MSLDCSVTRVSCPLLLHRCVRLAPPRLSSCEVLPRRRQTRSWRWVGFFLLCPILLGSLWKAYEIASACLHEEAQWVTKGEGISLEKNKNLSAGWGASQHLQLFVLVRQWDRDIERERERGSEWVADCRKMQIGFFFCFSFCPNSRQIGFVTRSLFEVGNHFNMAE